VTAEAGVGAGEFGSADATTVTRFDRTVAAFDQMVERGDEAPGHARVLSLSLDGYLPKAGMVKFLADAAN